MRYVEFGVKVFSATKVTSLLLSFEIIMLNVIWVLQTSMLYSFSHDMSDTFPSEGIHFYIEPVQVLLNNSAVKLLWHKLCQLSDAENA